MNVYRTNALIVRGGLGITRMQRFWVKFLRLFLWTLAARRQEWRRDCRWLEKAAANKVNGESRVIIRTRDGSVVKNVYVSERKLYYMDAIRVDWYMKHGHYKMPRI